MWEWLAYFPYSSYVSLSCEWKCLLGLLSFKLCSKAIYYCKGVGYRKFIELFFRCRADYYFEWRKLDFGANVTILSWISFGEAMFYNFKQPLICVSIFLIQECSKICLVVALFSGLNCNMLAINNFASYETWSPIS